MEDRNDRNGEKKPPLLRNLRCFAEMTCPISQGAKRIDYTLPSHSLVPPLKGDILVCVTHICNPQENRRAPSSTCLSSMHERMRERKKTTHWEKKRTICLFICHFGKLQCTLPAFLLLSPAVFYLAVRARACPAPVLSLDFRELP